MKKKAKFDCDYDAKFCDLDCIFYDNKLYFDCNGRYLEVLYETRYGYYEGEEEIKNNELFKKRFKQNFMRIKDYSEEEI